MKLFPAHIILILLSVTLSAQTSHETATSVPSPLGFFSAEWSNPQYQQCNTAAEETFMSGKEKEVIYILNLVRSNPKLFASSVLSKYPVLAGKKYLLTDKQYYQSLMNTLRTMEQQTLLYADEECFSSAACHAEASGKKGYMGHVRSVSCKTKKHFMGECCEYGDNDPLEIVISLLIDEGIPTLGHRKILLGDFESVGVAIRKHKTYRYNTVLDFY